MIKNKLARITIGLIFTLIYAGCSDTGKGSDEINNRDVHVNSVGKTEDGHDVLVFQEGEIENVLFKIDTATVSETEGFTGKLLFKDLDEDKIPKTGDVIASEQSTIAEYGFLYKILGVSTENGITTVEVRSASLEEAIEDVDFVSETEFQFDEDGNLVGALQKSYTFGNLQFSKDHTIKVGGVEIAKVETNVAYSVSLNFDISIKKWKLQSTKMSLAQNGDVSAKATLESFNAEARQELMSKNLGTITFWVGIVPVVITNELLVELKIKSEVQSGVEATYELNGKSEYGFEWKNGGFHKIADNSLSQSFNFEHQLSGNARLGVIFSLRSMLYGSAGFTIGAGPVLDLHVDGNPTGTHVFDNGFGADYSGYKSIWSGTGIADLESGSAAISTAINNSGSAASSNFSRTISNEAKLDLGMDFEAKITLKILKHELLSYTFAETYTKLKTLYRTSFLPLFDDPQITASDTDIEIISQIERDFLNYPVKSYGICIESPYSNECKNGQGTRVVKDGSLKAGSKHSIAMEFNNLVPGKSYAVRPYFSTGAGTFYDKATPYTHDVEYTLTVNRNLTTGGSLLVNGTASTGAMPYKHGTHVVVTAVENPGYEFIGWSGTSNSTNAEVIVTMNSNQALTANFQARTYTLMTNNSPSVGGSITRTPDKSSYTSGESITVTATPASGYIFIGWAGASDSENSTVAVTMDSDKTLIAMYNSLSATTTYPLTTVSIPEVGGTITRNPEWENYNHDAEVTVTAVPASTYRFTGWSGAATGTANPATITMDNYKTLTANFEHITYTLTTNASPAAGGVVTPSSNTYIVGTQVTVTATEQNGYRFTGWTGASTSTEKTVTITMDGNKTLTANFERIRYTLTTSVYPTAGGNISGGGQYDSGTNATVRATANSNYTFTHWSGAAEGSTANPVTIIMDGNKTLTANFSYILDTTFNTSITNYTFNKAPSGSPVTVEVYAVGGGGGGQGGHAADAIIGWSGCGTGGAGGGGAAAYMKFIATGSVTFDTIRVGGGGSGGSAVFRDVGQNWRSGNIGGDGVETRVRWSGNVLAVAGGKGGGEGRTSTNDASYRIVAGGSGGGSSTRPSIIATSDWASNSGDRGDNGSQDQLVASRGGSAGVLNIGSLSSFGGGTGGYNNSTGSACSPGGSFFNAGIGAGGTGGMNNKNNGLSGGNGQVRIRFTY